MYVPWSVILIVSPLLLFGVGMAIIVLVFASVAVANFICRKRHD